MHDYKFYLQVQTEAELFLLLMIIIENTSFIDIEEIWIILRLNRCSDTQQEFKPDRQEGLNCW
jgi:hypothetical protein